MSKAQDNIRENLQKERYGFGDEHIRDQTYDASCEDLKIDFKSFYLGKGCTTKREYKNDPFSDVVLVVSAYKNKTTITDNDWIVFPPALEEWRRRQEWELMYDNGTKPCYMEIDYIFDQIENPVDQEKNESIRQKLKRQVFKNDPKIPWTFFKSNGKYCYVNKRKVPVKHSEWMVPVPPDCDRKKFLRQQLKRYKQFKLNKEV